MLHCHHLYIEGACVHCDQPQIQPAAQGYTARAMLRSTETLLKRLAETRHPDGYCDLHDTAEGLAAELELYPQTDAFHAGEFLRNACAALRLLGLERKRTVTYTDALRENAFLALRQACDVFRDWERVAELAHGREKARE